MHLSKERAVLFTLASVQFTNILDFVIMLPLGPQLMRVLNITPEQFSWVLSSYTFSAFTASVAGTFWLDRFDRKKVLLINYLLFLAGTAACGLSPNYEFLLAARIFTGLFGGVMGSIAMSIVSDMVPIERRTSAMSIVMMAFSLASVAGIPAGLALANAFEWHTPFWAVVALGAVNWVLIAVVIPPVNGHLKAGYDPNTALNLWKSLWFIPIRSLALVAHGMIFFGQFAIISFISPYMVKNVGFGEQNLMFIYIIGGGLTVFTSPIIGRWSDKLGKNWMFRRLALISVIPILMLAYFPSINLITDSRPLGMAAVLTVAGLFFIFVNGRTIPAYTMITAVVPPKERGGYMSLASSVGQLASGGAAWVAGKIVTENLNTHQLLHFERLGWWAVFFTLMAVVLFGRLNRMLKEV